MTRVMSLMWACVAPCVTLVCVRDFIGVQCAHWRPFKLASPNRRSAAARARLAARRAPPSPRGFELRWGQRRWRKRRTGSLLEFSSRDGRAVAVASGS